MPDLATIALLQPPFMLETMHHKNSCLKFVLVLVNISITICLSEDDFKNILPDKNTSIISIDNGPNSLHNLIQCCSQLFSAIQLDIGDLEKLSVAKTLKLLQEISSTPGISLWVSAEVDAAKRGKDILSEVRQLIQRNTNRMHLIDKIILSIPLIFCEPHPVTDNEETVDTFMSDLVNSLQQLKQLLQQSSNTTLGFQPTVFSTNTECYNSKMPGDTAFDLIQNFGALMVKVTLDNGIYTYSEFSDFVDKMSLHTLKRIRLMQGKHEVLLDMRLFDDLRLSKGSRHQYYEMMANFTFRYGKERGIRVKFTMRRYGADSRSSEFGSPKMVVFLNEWIVEGNLNYQELEKYLTIVSSDFSTILIDPPTSKEWNAVLHNFLENVYRFNMDLMKTNTSKMSVIVRLKCLTERGQNVTNFLVEIKHLQEKFPTLISGLVVQLMTCESNKFWSSQQRTSGTKRWLVSAPRWSPRKLAVAQREADFIKRTAAAFDILVLAVDESNYTHHFDEQSPGLLVSDYRTEFYSKNGTRFWMNVLEGMRHNESNRRIWAEFNWDSYEGRDCGFFNEISQMVLKWSSIHEIVLIVNSAFDNVNSKGGWYKTVGQTRHNVVLISKFEDPCVSFSQGPILEKIEFNQTLTAISLNINVSEIVSDDLNILLEIVTLRFTNLELKVGDFREANDVLEKVSEVYNSGSSPRLLQIYLNMIITKKSDFSNVRKEIVAFRSKLRRMRSFCKLVGIHFETEIDIKEASVKQLKEAISLLRRHFRDDDWLKLGVILKDDMPPDFKLDVYYELRFINYILVDVDLPHHFGTNLAPIFATLMKPNKNQIKFRSIFNKIRGFRLSIEEIHVDVKLKFRWPTASRNFICTSQTRSELENMLRFWRFVNDFCSTFNFPYIIEFALEFKQDCDDLMGEGEESEYILTSGWWQFPNFSAVDSYVEKESQFLGLPTPKPATPKLDFNKTDGDFRMTNDVVHIFVGGGLVLAFLVTVIITLAVVLHKRNEILSKVEVQAFIKGLEEDLNGLSGELRILGLAYNSNLEIVKEEFNASKSCIIGTGHFGIVYKADIPRFDEPVAVKIPQSGKNISDREGTIRSFLSEIKIMSFLSEHENVVKILGAYTKEISKGVAYLVTEFCEKGNLQSYLHCIATSLDPGKTRRVNVYELQRFSQEIAAGMEYIAGKNIIHGDLSTRNVLLNDLAICKICDFGLSKKLDKYGKYVKGEKEILPWRWMAIESLKKMEFTVKSDVWSYGVTLWEIFTLADIPFPERNWNEEFVRDLENGMRLSCPKFASAESYKLFCQCWELDPVKRPTFSELKPLFQQFQRNEYTQVAA